MSLKKTSKTKSTTNKYKHTTWASSWGFIFAATGAAVGLGNIWKFPYMAGDNGGAPFVLIYLLAILFLGLPLMIAEILLGRMGRKNPINTMKDLAKKNNCSTKWQLTGWWGALALMLTLSFYCVIAGWSVAYFFKYLGYTLGIGSNYINYSQDITVQIINQWNGFIASPISLLIWQLAFMAMTLAVVMGGVTKGIEKASNIMMPFLFLILFILAGYAAYYGDFYAGFNFLFKPDLTKINSTVIIEALGHACFTLAIGAGCMLTYGAYLPEHTSIIKSVFIIATLDVLVAFLSGIAIFPIVFASHLEPNAGPDLMFKVLPIAFTSMPFGNFVGMLFFLLLTFAAWTSSISMLEPLVMIVIEKLGFRRDTSCLLIGIISLLIGAACALSFNIWGSFLLFNKWNIFTAITDLVTNVLLPVGGILFAVFAGWKVRPNSARQILIRQHDHHFKIWHFLIKYVVPAGIVFILVSSLV